ncbi:MAG: 3-isopropylmalate dehydratase large subunit [Gammaproteobacteria bacterium]
MEQRTLYDKLWDEHVVEHLSDGNDLIYIDRHLLHEVTSPQAFEGLHLARRKPWRVASNYAVPDHNVPTTPGRDAIKDPDSKLQVETLAKHCRETGIVEFTLNDIRQGIVHIIGPEQGLTLPGMTIVCGDSHTSTHGAFGTIAMGIGTSEVEHVLATQCLVSRKMKNKLIQLNGRLQPGVFAKDIILALIGKLGTAGGTGFAIEFKGDTLAELSMESRMTLCNMAIEAGARCGLIAVDTITLAYLKDRPFAPKNTNWDRASQYWQTLRSDVNASYSSQIELEISQLAPQVTWGTTPEMVCSVLDSVPDPDSIVDPIQKANVFNAIRYMGLKPNQAIQDIKLDRIFIGSCTNSRIEDLRIAADVIKGKHIAKSIKQALVVPGSGLVKAEAEQEGLHEIFLRAGFEWRLPGCSMCIAMNPDRLMPGEHCASTSNRNFEGRQGRGGRTHLVSPAMAAIAAIEGRFVDVRQEF